MLPFNKAQWYLGYSSLMIITEQDRRHWLLKTDKMKEVTDGNTGGMFLGQIDNEGSYINVSTQKLSSLHPILKQYIPTNLSTVFELCPSALPFSYDVNGLCCARIVSTQYPYETSNKNFKIVFLNCEEVYIPFANGNNNNVYGYHWIKTTTKPKLYMLDEFNEYTISVDVSLTITNGTYYYPLDTFQPIEIEDKGSGRYETVLIDSNSYIGYPGFWFTCDKTNVGPQFSMDDNVQKFNYCGNSKTDMYSVNVYIMDKLYVTNDEVRVYPADGYTFSNTDIDYTIPLDLERIQLKTDGSPGPVIITPISVTSSEGNQLYMTQGAGWINSGHGYYSILVRDFNTNYSTHEIPLRPLFKLLLNSSIPFEKSTNDIGFAGIDITTNSQSNEYPFNLNNWTGLPEWINDERASSQRLVIYAIHNTPNSSEENPESRQTAALLFEPGIPYDSEDDPEEYDDSRIGRVYVLSNDDPVYENNAIATHPKPNRTVARICDIPVSVAQLSNISGIAPTSIVDPKYVRSEASYTEDEKYRLFNTLSSRWVRPIHYTIHGQTAMDEFPTSETNPHVFNSLSHLILIDVENHNDFREHLHLNEMVDASEVSLFMITQGGSDYRSGDVGNIIIGGFAFNYEVQSVGDDGDVLTATISPSSYDWKINIANFDMMEGTTGITKQYGTSPVGDSHGTGLKLQLQIANYTSKIPTLGNVYDDLFALCRNSQGLWLYTYNTSSKDWDQSICISEYEATRDGEVSTQDSYINSILPNVNSIPVGRRKADEPEASLTVISTASYINVVDKSMYPVLDQHNNINEINVADIGRFYCDHIYTLTARFKRFDDVMEMIKTNHYNRFDSYIIWRWKDENDSNNKEFEFGIIHRSLNNYQSMDWKTTTLPSNELPNKNYVHTNASTTITWDLPDYCMTMVWTFNPNSHVHESYYIDQNTRELSVSRKKITWNDIDIYTDGFQTKLDMFDSNGKLLWNIASNILQPSDIRYERDPIYQQPDYVDYIRKGVSLDSISEQYQPIGNWQLIFPRIQTLTFRNQSGYEYKAKNIHKLNVVKNVETQERTDLLDFSGNPVNDKTLILNINDDNTASVKVYNTSTGKWDEI